MPSYASTLVATLPLLLTAPCRSSAGVSTRAGSAACTPLPFRAAFSAGTWQQRGGGGAGAVSEWPQEPGQRRRGAPAACLTPV